MAVWAGESQTLVCVVLSVFFSAKSGVQYPCEVTVALFQEKIMN